MMGEVLGLSDYGPTIADARRIAAQCRPFGGTCMAKGRSGIDSIVHILAIHGSALSGKGSKGMAHGAAARAK